MCWYLFHALFFTFFTPVYTKCRCFVFSSIFPLHNCIKVCSSLKSILSITIFYVVGKPLFLCVSSRTAFHTFSSPKRVDEGFLLYYIFFTYKIDFLAIFYFIVLYFIHSTLTLDENRKCLVDWFVADEIGMSTNNDAVAIFRICVTLNIL